MTIGFSVELNPSKELLQEIETFVPTNPFYTSAYIEATRLLGFQPCILTLQRNGQLTSACTAFMTSGRLNRSLEITSLPTLPSKPVFWEGLLQFCRKAGVSQLQVNSFASASAAIPTLPGEIQRSSRGEYVLELQKPDLWDRLSSNHVRNIKRGCRVGLQVHRAGNEEACQEHARLVGESMQRRKSRGESILEDIQARTFMAITQSRAGTLFQAVLNGKVLSSVLVLMAKKGAYYQSAGTSAEGMACGASHFLVHEIAKTLQTESMQLFNLGGAGPHNPGLERFKAGFGPTTVKLEAAEFFLGGIVQKKLGATAQMLRDVVGSDVLRRIRRRLRFMAC